MDNLHNLKLKTLIDAGFKSKVPVRFRANGFSMSPFIKNGDFVILKACSPERGFRVGDIVALNPEGEKIIVHRIIKIKKELILLKGDNCIDSDGIFDKARILGVVFSIERNGKNTKYYHIFNYLIAFLSRSGLLTSYILPTLRRFKSGILKYVQ